MNKVKNIIFDLGGVVINLRRENAVEALEALGIAGADEMLGLYCQKDPFLGVETGHLTAGEFFDTMRHIAGHNIPDVELQEAFNRFLIDIPAERLRGLRALRNAGYRLFVLSNTNPIMYNSWIAAAFRQEGLTINDYFDGIVTSFQEGTCKPDPEIFRILLRRYGLDPEETVMLDDSEANCDAARSTGMKAIRITDSGDTAVMEVIGRFLEFAQ